MPLTNQAWEKNFRLQAVTTGGNPLLKNEKGKHIEILRKNLEAIGFERTLEPMDFFGSSTGDMIRDFRQIYAITGKLDVVDKLLLETLDGILNKRIPQKKFKDGQLANVSARGMDFAVRYLATTKKWVEDALKTCRSVEQSLTTLHNAAKIPGKAQPDMPFGNIVYLPFMQHFRLQICYEAAADAARNRLGSSLMLCVADVDGANSNANSVREVLAKVTTIGGHQEISRQRSSQDF